MILLVVREVKIVVVELVSASGSCQTLVELLVEVSFSWDGPRDSGIGDSYNCNRRGGVVDCEISDSSCYWMAVGVRISGSGLGWWWFSSCSCTGEVSGRGISDSCRKVSKRVGSGLMILLVFGEVIKVLLVELVIASGSFSGTGEVSYW